jgi:hypothetical protein
MKGAPDDLLALVDTELSAGSRLVLVSLLVASAMATVAVGIKGLTTPALPLAGRIEFAMISALGVLSIVLGLRTLSRRGALLARQRVIAGRIAVASAAIVVLASSLIAWAKNIPAAYYVAGFGVFLLAGTIALLRQENRKLAALNARRHALAQQLKIQDLPELPQA